MANRWHGSARHTPAGRLAHGPAHRERCRGARDQAELRRIPTIRNAITVVGIWAQVVGVLVAAAWLSHPIAWIAAFFLMGRSFALLAILGHEAAHRLLFPKKSVGDFVGRWLASYPNFLPYDVYRRAHMAHHRVEFGPTEPDMNFYSGFRWAGRRCVAS